jgi:hypothetical protein
MLQSWHGGNLNYIPGLCSFTSYSFVFVMWAIAGANEDKTLSKLKIWSFFMCFFLCQRDGSVGGYPKNSDDYPNTRESSWHVQVQSESAKRLWFPPRVAQVPKSLNPFTRALAPPFIGRRRDFYIPITPLASENIPSVNAYKIVFFI